MKRCLILIAILVAACALPVLAQTCPPPANWCSGIYQYDGMGNITAIGNDTYVYDTVGRLMSGTADVQRTGVMSRQDYGYDAFSNRISATRTPGSVDCLGGCEQSLTIDPATNHITSNGAVYDAAGNLIFIQTTVNNVVYGSTYTYDGTGSLARATAGGDDRQFIYTANGERIAVRNGQSWTWTVRGLDGKVLREFTSLEQNGLPTANRQWAKDYIWRDGLLLANVAPTTPGASTTVTQHFHLDHLGTPRMVTNDAGVQIGIHTYYPFGAELNLSPNEGELMKFTGHERDLLASNPNTLDYMHARYEMATMGRFLSVDPVLPVDAIRAPQLWNRYAYVSNNPMNRIDPTGKVLEVSGTEEDRRKVELIANGGLNGYQLKINGNGTASLAKTTANGKETSEQQALRESLQKVIGDKATTTIYAASNTNTAVIGQFSNCTIDPADMQQFGTAQPNAASALGHEVMEQYGKQVMGMVDIGYAHVWAMQYENMFTGWVRGGQTPGQRGPGSLVYGDVRYTRGDQKMDVRLTVDPQTLNVTSIVRRDVP